MSRTNLRMRLSAILAADAVGYSRLMAVDELMTVAALDAARAIFKARIESNHGRIIDMAGDSVLAVFESAIAAISTALEIQGELGNLIAGVPEDQCMRFRIGIHLGDLIEKPDGTVYGDGVNIASRLEGLAEPGGICVSESVRTAVRGKLPANFEDLGEQSFKNLSEPVRTYRVGVQDGEVAKASAPVAPAELSLPDKPSIAVLPFANMSGDPGQEYFTDGITEDIITGLSRFHSLFVISRNSSFTYRGKAVDVRTVAKELGVRYVLEGSIRRFANRIRVTVQLVDALSGSHLWADKYDRILEDVFAVQEELTEAIVAVIAPQVETEELNRAHMRRPESLGAYELAVRANGLVWKSVYVNDKSLRVQGIELAKAALSIDPRSVIALNAVAHACFRQIWHGTSLEATTDWQQGIDAATRSIDADPTNGLAYAFKAALLACTPSGGRTGEAQLMVNRARELNPNDSVILVAVGLVEHLAGNSMAALEPLRRAIRISPRAQAETSLRALLCAALIALKDYRGALEQLQKGLSVAPNQDMFLVQAAVVYVGIGDLTAARQAYDKACRLAPEMIRRQTGSGAKSARSEYAVRYRTFLRVAAGLEDASVADALR